MSLYYKIVPVLAPANKIKYRVGAFKRRHILWDVYYGEVQVDGKINGFYDTGVIAEFDSTEEAYKFIKSVFGEVAEVEYWRAW